MILYPVYLDVSQKVGARKISKDSCIEMPTIKEMELAALSLGLEVTVEQKRHPRTPFEIGRLRLNQSGLKKRKVLAELSLAIKHAREGSKNAQTTKQTDSADSKQNESGPTLVRRKKKKGRK